MSHGTKELPVYALVVAKNGPKLQEAKPGDTYPNGIKGPDGRALGHGGMMRMGPGQLTGQGVPMTFLVQQLSQQLGRTVLDQTGLKGNYDFTLKWTPDQSPAGDVSWGRQAAAQDLTTHPRPSLPGLRFSRRFRNSLG